MNWQTVFSNKLKVASILLGLMAAIVASNIMEKNLLKSNQSSVASIYEDRLQPATYLFEMRQLLANKIFFLEALAKADKSSEIEFRETIQKIDGDFKKLLLKYEATFLVEKEADFLKQLKTNIKRFEELGNKLLSERENVEHILPQLTSLSNEINDNLGQLSKLQSEVGKEMLTNFVNKTSISHGLNTLQILLALAIGMIVYLLFANKKISIVPFKTHHLN